MSKMITIVLIGFLTITSLVFGETFTVGAVKVDLDAGGNFNLTIGGIPVLKNFGDEEQFGWGFPVPSKYTSNTKNPEVVVDKKDNRTEISIVNRGKTGSIITLLIIEPLQCTIISDIDISSEVWGLKIARDYGYPDRKCTEMQLYFAPEFWDGRIAVFSHQGVVYPREIKKDEPFDLGTTGPGGFVNRFDSVVVTLPVGKLTIIQPGPESGAVNLELQDGRSAKPWAFRMAAGFPANNDGKLVVKEKLEFVLEPSKDAPKASPSKK